MICILKAIHYCGLMFLKTLENFVQNCINQIQPARFLSAPGLAWQAAFKKAEIELGPLTDFGMLLMVEKGIRGRICHCISRYAKSNKYMKDYES